jgi:hypothetical protein
LLEKLIRKFFAQFGITELTSEDILRFVRFTKLDKLPNSYLFALTTVYPIIELVINKLQKEDIDFEELTS